MGKKEKKKHFFKIIWNRWTNSSHFQDEYDMQIRIHFRSFTGSAAVTFSMAATKNNLSIDIYDFMETFI